MAKGGNIGMNVTSTRIVGGSGGLLHFANV